MVEAQNSEEILNDLSDIIGIFLELDQVSKEITEAINNFVLLLFLAMGIIKRKKASLQFGAALLKAVHISLDQFSKIISDKFSQSYFFGSARQFYQLLDQM